MLQQELTNQIDINGNLSRLYYDLAGGPSVQAVKMLLTITTPDHLLYGSDYPFVPAAVLETIIGRMKNELSADPEMGKDVEDIFSGNAQRLFLNQLKE